MSFRSRQPCVGVVVLNSLPPIALAHSFPGFDPESKELDAEVLKKYIYGGHVAEYMESLEEEDDERYVWSSPLSCHPF